MIAPFAMMIALAAPTQTCSTPPALLAPLSASSYATDFNGVLWNGEKAQYRAVISIAPGTPVSVAYDGKSAKTVAPYPGGCAIPSGNDQAVSTLDAALALASGAPKAPSHDAPWHTTVSVQVSQDQSIDVPVTVTYSPQAGGAALLQGTGHASGVLTAFGTPFELEYQAAAVFAGGHLIKARSAAQEKVEAGPQSQTMKLAWDVQRRN